MTSVESFAHKTAKTLVAEWLRSAAQKAGEDHYANLSPFSWRVNRAGPYWGIWEEYPLINHDDPIVWDEAGYELPPSFSELKKLGIPPAVILDIAIQHKGRIMYGVEIVNKNPPSEQKRFFLDCCDFPVYLVKSSWVLAQVRMPKAIKFYEVISGNGAPPSFPGLWCEDRYPSYMAV